MKLTDYKLTDGERLALLGVAIAVARGRRTPEARERDLLNAIAKLTGTDTVVTVSRTCPPKAIEA